MWNLTWAHQLALLLLCVICPSVLTGTTVTYEGDMMEVQGWGFAEERTDEAPSLQCTYPNPGLLPSKVIGNFLESLSNRLRAPSNYTEYEQCLASFETFACGRYCYPQQAMYLNLVEKSYAICSSFCQSLYSSCRNVVVASSGKTVASLYTTSKKFCEAQNLNNYSIVVNPSELCFVGFNLDASASHAYASGVGYWLSEEGEYNGTPQARSGVPHTEYCFNVQVEDFYENPKQVGGDLVSVTLVDTASPNVTSDLATVDNNDGSYSTCFTPTTSTTLNISYSINENDFTPFAVYTANLSWCPLKTPNGYIPQPAADLAVPCSGSNTDASCCPEFATSSCCDASDTSKIVNYVNGELVPVFSDLPECLAEQQKLLCGLSCDPGQSEYVDAYHSAENANATVTFYLCESYCDALYNACGSAVIGNGQAGIPINVLYDTPDAFCQSLVPSYLNTLVFTITPNNGSHTCFSGYATPDACQSYAYGYGDSLAGEEASFTIQSRTAYGANLTNSEGYTWTVTLMSATGSSVEANVTDNNDGTFSVNYVATQCGYYTMTIYLVLSGQHLEFCEPITVAVFPSSPSPANFVVFGDGLFTGYQDLPAYFTIQARDQYGNNITSGGETFTFLMVSASRGISVQDISYTDNSNGTYTVRYVAPLPGIYNLSISAGASQLVGFFTVTILPVDAWRAFGIGLSLATAGEIANFTLQHYNRLTNENITTDTAYQA